MSSVRPLKIVFEKKRGRLSELLEILDEHTIRQLEAISYIEISNDSWKITSKGEYIGNLKYKKSNFIEKLIDWYYFKVCGVNFNF